MSISFSMHYSRKKAREGSMEEKSIQFKDMSKQTQSRHLREKGGPLQKICFHVYNMFQ